jgi:Family of unknown function (DUF5654)
MEVNMNQAKMLVQTMITLASASLGLVAALAWNDAIKTLIEKTLKLGDSVEAKFLYAVIATAIAVIALVSLSRLAARIGGEAVITRESDN